MALPNPTITAIADGHHATGAIASAPHDELLANDAALDATLSLATAAATADRIMKRDSGGRAKVVAPAAESDIALLSTVTAHANLNNPHNSTSAPTASRLMLRDASGRSQVAAPSAAADIANKGYVDGKLYTGRVDDDGTAFNLPSGWTSARTAAGSYTITHNLGSNDYNVVVSPRFNSPAPIMQLWSQTSNSFIITSRYATTYTEHTTNYALDANFVFSLITF